MPKYQRNVKLHQRRFERFLTFNRFLNRFLSHSAQLTLTALIWPRYVAPYRWELTRHPLRFAGLGPAFNGYKILHLTDIHMRRRRIAHLMAAAEKCLAEEPDLVVITGDLIDYHPNSIAPIRKWLDRIVAAKPRDGVVVIFGNHDYHEYSWRHIGARSAHRICHRALVDNVEQSGAILLRNEQHRISRPDSQDLIVVGIDEMWTTLADADKAFAGLGPTDPIVCLQHNPDGISFLEPYPWQIMLCGHSHGGQAHFPLLGPLYIPMERRDLLQGFFEWPLLPGQPAALGKRRMFVSRGLGQSTPIRLFCPPEATLFTIEAV
ncbi:MAG TPA: metallophosphoesterase [Phycisphaerae bacterium]|nr:metallophosphoesterase [Phycisphaerae bacterium]